MQVQTESIFERSGSAIVVLGLHIVVVYVLALNMGVVRAPIFYKPLEAVFIPETKPQEQEQIVIPVVDISIAKSFQPVMPDLTYEEPVVETPAPVSDAPPAPMAISTGDSSAPSSAQ